MSCKQKRGYNFLDVESEIARSKCKFKPGESATHTVTMTSYAVRDVEVSFRCRCPGQVMGYPNSPDRHEWHPDPVTLPAVGANQGPRSFPFTENLGARTTSGHHLPRSEQLKLEPWRRKLPSGPDETLPELPIDVSIE